MTFLNGKQGRSPAAQGRARVPGALGALRVPVRRLAAPATLPVAARQQRVQQCCHNYEDYAAGVEFEVFNASKDYGAGPLQGIKFQYFLARK